MDNDPEALLARTKEIKLEVEEVLREKKDFPPRVYYYRKSGDLVLRAVMRPSSSGDAEEAKHDYRLAMNELLTIVHVFEIDHITLGIDATHGSIDEYGNRIEVDALSVYFADRDGAEGIVVPYDRDEDGWFAAWRENDDDFLQGIDISDKDQHLFSALAHYMKNYRRFSYPDLYRSSLVATLAKRGHELELFE